MNKVNFPSITYVQFSQMPTDSDLERISKEKVAAAKAAIPDLRNYWLELLHERPERPRSVDELVALIPTHLQHVKYYALPAGSEGAVARVFEGDERVSRRYGGSAGRNNFYYGLSALVVSEPHAVNDS